MHCHCRDMLYRTHRCCYGAAAMALNNFCCMQAKVFKGAFDARKEKGLWGDSATAGVQQLQSKGLLAWLWGLVAGCMALLFGRRAVHR